MLTRKALISCLSGCRYKSVSLANVTPKPQATFGTIDFKINYVDANDSTPLSPWHDIPLTDKPHTFLYVNEIPKGEKMEINKQKAFNPIVQDIKKGVLRKFTYGDIPFNYGAIPQTWEDTEGHDVVMNGTPLHGDNDPLDVVEIGATPLEMGHVYRTKILGCLALVDEGELDWKLIGVNENDPLFNTLRDIQDLKQSNPELLAKIIDWFKMYKTTDGKGENQFALNGEVMDAKYAKHVIENTHNSWKDLIKNGREGIWTKI